MKKNKLIPIWTVELLDRKTKKSNWVYLIAPESRLSHDEKRRYFNYDLIKDYFKKSNISGMIFLGYINRLSNLNEKYFEIKVTEEKEIEQDE